MTGTSSTSYNYRQYAYLDDNGVWQAAATPASDVTNGVDYFGASGTTNWSLSGSGPVGTYQFGTGYVSGVYGANSGSGTTSASGSGSDTYNYQELFSYSPATNQWTPTGGSGSASGSGSATFGYSAGGDLTDTGPWGPWDEAYTGVERMMVGMGDAANDWSGTSPPPAAPPWATAIRPARTSRPAAAGRARAAPRPPSAARRARVLGQRVVLGSVQRRRRQQQRDDGGHGLRQRRRLEQLRLFAKRVARSPVAWSGRTAAPEAGSGGATPPGAIPATTAHGRIPATARHSAGR